MAEIEVELKLEFEHEDTRLADLSVCRIRLHEQVSRPFSCTVTFLSTQSLPFSLLTSLLKSGVILTLSSISGNNTSELRKVRGMVSSYNFLGVCYANSPRGQIMSFAYELVLEPRLVLAQYNRKIRSYSSWSAPDLIKEMLGEYNSAPVFDANLINTALFNAKQIFNQQQQSDFDFIHNLMSLYGLNYCFDHNYETGKEKSFLPQLYFASSWQMLPADDTADNSDDTKSDGTVLTSSFSEKDLGEGILLDSIKMAGTLGAEIETGYFGSSGNDKADYPDNRLFELYNAVGSVRGSDSSAETFNRSLIQFYLTSALNNSCAVVSGSSTDARVRPGQQFQLPSEVEENCTCLIKSIDLTAQAAVADSFELFQNADRGVKIEFTAIRIDDKKVPGCLLIEKPADLDEIFPQNSEIITGAVCNSKGETSCCANETAVAAVTVPGEADTQQPELIQVKLDGSSSIILCDLTVPGGSSDDGWYRYPKLGDQVMVGMSRGRFYLQGFAPAAVNLPSCQTEKRLDQLSSSPWRHQAVNSTAVKTAGSLDAGTTEIEHVQFKSDSSYVQNAIYKGQLDNLVRQVTAQRNNSGISNTYETTYKTRARSLADDYDKLYLELTDLVQQRENEYASLGSKQGSEVPGENNFKSDKDSAIAKKKQELEAKADEISTLSTNVSSLLSLGSSYAASSLNLNSGGNIQLSAEGGIIDHSCTDCNVTASGAVTVTADGTVTISSESKIKFAVGANSITLDQNGITLESLKYASGGGPFDTFIKMDSISGVSVSGMAVGLKGVWSVMMGDSFGGEVKALNGMTSIKGHQVTIETNDCEKLISNLARFSIELVTELATIGADSKKANSAVYGVGTALDLTNCIVTLVNKISSEKKETIDVVNAILSTIISLSDIAIEIFLASNQSAVLSKKLGGSQMTVRDMIRILALTFKATMMATTLGVAIAKSSFKLSSNIILGSSSIALTAKNGKASFAESNVNNSPLSGL